jgi:hypothetical protein
MSSGRDLVSTILYELPCEQFCHVLETRNELLCIEGNSELHHAHNKDMKSNYIKKGSPGL